MERNNIYLDVVKEVTNELSEKYPGLTDLQVRNILLKSMDIMFKQAMNGRSASIDSKSGLKLYVIRKDGYNYVSKSKRGSRAVSDIKIGVELCFEFAGKRMNSGIVKAKVSPRMQKRLCSLANNEKYLNSVL